ncbi:MAG: hypothetical protein AVDCRST_MAG93-2263 [uncultured Chloroflexia bacterium]|uniref:Uncharacterized protein n=1 Tax=uncultured Chloroflexia bacterium TaxID=1672391 RepID=A0A6J4IZF5_9CHLR|nr:MAG: hypothetical protein AVDCRST_MAG93-2263 [uncultured Chloroflexia bacterium]
MPPKKGVHYVRRRESSKDTVSPLLLSASSMSCSSCAEDIGM